MAMKQPTTYTINRDTVFARTNNGVLFLLSVEDVDLLNTSWTLNKAHGYLVRNKPLGSRKAYLTEALHKLVAARLGYTSPEVDHRNRIRLDNRRHNLRPSNQEINGWNRGPMQGKLRKNNTGIPGLRFMSRAGGYYLVSLGGGKSKYFKDFEPALEFRKTYVAEKLRQAESRL